MLINPFSIMFKFKLSNREDYLRYNEVFRIDKGKTKMTEEKNRTFWYWKDELNDKIMGMIIEEATDKEAKLEEVKELLWDFDHRFTNKSDFKYTGLYST